MNTPEFCRRLPTLLTGLLRKGHGLSAENVALKARIAAIESCPDSPRADRALTPDRGRELKRIYVEHVERLKEGAHLDAAMENAVGGKFDQIGAIEVGILRHYGLRPDDSLIDVGCGSGRLAQPLSVFLQGSYAGFDLVDELVAHARKIVARPDWRFATVDHIEIPCADGSADMVCFFSVMTHLLHEQSYWYLEEAKRVLRPGGRIVASFLEFAEPGHWAVFDATLQHAKQPLVVDPLNVFIERSVWRTWADHLGLDIEDIRDAGDPICPEGALGQSICVMHRSN